MSPTDYLKKFNKWRNEQIRNQNFVIETDNGKCEITEQELKSFKQCYPPERKENSTSKLWEIRRKIFHDRKYWFISENGILLNAKGGVIRLVKPVYVGEDNKKKKKQKNQRIRLKYDLRREINKRKTLRKWIYPETIVCLVFEKNISDNAVKELMCDPLIIFKNDDSKGEVLELHHKNGYSYYHMTNDSDQDLRARIDCVKTNVIERGPQLMTHEEHYLLTNAPRAINKVPITGNDEVDRRNIRAAAAKEKDKTIEYLKMASQMGGSMNGIKFIIWGDKKTGEIVENIPNDDFFSNDQGKLINGLGNIALLQAQFNWALDTIQQNDYFSKLSFFSVSIGNQQRFYRIDNGKVKAANLKDLRPDNIVEHFVVVQDENGEVYVMKPD